MKWCTYGVEFMHEVNLTLIFKVVFSHFKYDKHIGNVYNKFHMLWHMRLAVHLKIIHDKKLTITIIISKRTIRVESSGAGRLKVKMIKKNTE